MYPSGYYELKDDKVPCIQWRSKAQCNRYKFKNNYDAGDYIKDFYLDGSYPIWQEEYDIIKQCYNVTQESIEKVWYIELAENTILKPYIEHLYKGKQTNTGSRKLYYKYLLNALYGKFLTRPDGIGIDYQVINGKWTRVKIPTEKKVNYMPLGSWIAMMGRVTLMKAILSIDQEDFIYCDTDSIIFKGDKFPNVEIGENLKQWGYEIKNVCCNIVGPKTYQELKIDYDGYNMKRTFITKCGGLPRKDKDKVPWGTLSEGLIVQTAKPRRDTETWAINIEPIEYTINTRATAFFRS